VSALFTRIDTKQFTSCDKLVATRALVLVVLEWGNDVVYNRDARNAVFWYRMQVKVEFVSSTPWCFVCLVFF
jgi:hypothetical protein